MSLAEFDFDIILDCDGVLANFRGAILDAIGLTEEDLGPEGSTTYALFPFMPDDKRKESYKILSTEEFWATIPKFPWADDLVQAALSWGDVQVYTRAWDAAGAFSGKYLWLKKNYPDIPFQIGSKDSEKDIAAGSRVLLIDDKRENVLQFREAGGLSFLWPAHYNDRKTLRPDRIKAGDWEGPFNDALDHIEAKLYSVVML